jgi:microcystin-dependent protein
MAQPYIGEIRMFAGNFAPVGWLFCEGQLIAISENDALFTLIGTTYGGDGQETFALPDLRGRIPVHQGNGAMIGERDGSETVTLTVPQMPAHSHSLLAVKAVGDANSVAGNLLAETPGGVKPYIEDAPSLNMSPNAVAPSGGSQPHENLQPYLCLNFIISLFGIFPSQT